MLLSRVLERVHLAQCAAHTGDTRPRPTQNPSLTCKWGYLVFRKDEASGILGKKPRYIVLVHAHAHVHASRNHKFVEEREGQQTIIVAREEEMSGQSVVNGLFGWVFVLDQPSIR